MAPKQKKTFSLYFRDKNQNGEKPDNKNGLNEKNWCVCKLVLHLNANTTDLD